VFGFAGKTAKPPVGCGFTAKQLLSGVNSSHLGSSLLFTLLPAFSASRQEFHFWVPTFLAHSSFVIQMGITAFRTIELMTTPACPPVCFLWWLLIKQKQVSARLTSLQHWQRNIVLFQQLKGRNACSGQSCICRAFLIWGVGIAVQSN
jgi:hypothetical protein